MSNSKVTVEFELKDAKKSVDSADASGKRLNKTLERTKELTEGTRGGSRAAAAAFGQTEYNTARGTVGTGASGRDFAKQSRDLDGLVRLYAVYAANIFAAGAAFRALSDAMDTDRMISGLNQLGAASGITMGGLAKQFAAASGGAISLRESMEATAKAISSGLSTKQFMDLGLVAKGASQALGVNMSDAISRLTRGITKLEPELLDELGIFTKVGKASEDYARSVGKSVDSLTDFEKRQAFANAVLAEGSQKFGAIAAEANPYNELLAELKNTAQGILSVVNSIIAPIAKLLADNTGLIAAAIAVSVVKITKEALPALLSWRKGLADAAAEAARKANDINTSFGEAFVERYQGKFQLPQVSAQLDAVKKEYAEKSKIFLAEQNALDKNSAITKSIASGQVLSTRKIGSLQAEVTKRTGDTNIEVQKHVQGLQTLILLQTRMNALAKQELDIYNKVEDVSGRKAGYLSETAQRERIVSSERSKVARMTEVSKVSDLVSEKGLAPGLQQFYKDVDLNKDLTSFDRLRTKGVGSLVAIATAANILARSLTGVLFWIEILTAAFLVADTIFGKNSKQIDNLNGSLELLTETTKTATAVNEKYANSLSIDSINARANAFTTLADGIKKANKDLISADETASWFDKNVKDNFKVIYGGDIRSQFAKGLTESIVGAIEAAPAGEMRDSLQEKLREATGLTDLTRTEMTSAWTGMNLLSADQVRELGGKISAILESANAGLKQAQAVTQNIKETEKAVKESFLTLKNSVSDKSPMTLFFQATIKQARALELALNDTYGAGIALQGISKGEISTGFLNPQQAMAIQPLADEASKLVDQSQKYSNNLDSAQKKLSAIQAEYDKLNAGGPLAKVEASKLLPEISGLKNIINLSNQGLNSINTRLKEIADTAKTLIRDSIVKQIDESMRQVGLRLRQIGIQAEQSILGKMPEATVAQAEAQGKLEREALAIERDLFKSQENLVRSLDLLTLQIKRDQDIRQIESLNAQEARDGGLDPLLKKRRTQLELGVAETDKAVAAYGARDLKTLTDLAKQNPALESLLPGASGMLEAQKRFNTSIQQSLLNERLKVSDIGFGDQRAELQRRQQEIQAKQSDITLRDNILAQNGLARALDALREEEAKIPKAQAQAQLDIIDKFAKEYPTAAEVAKATREKVQTTAAAEAGVRGSASDIAEQNRLIQAQVRLTKEQYDVEGARRFQLESLTKNQEQGILNENALSREKIAKDLDSLKISEDQATAARYNLDLMDAQIQRNQALRQAQEDLTTSAQKYALDRIALGGQTNDTLEAEKSRYEATYSAAVTGANQAYQAQKKLLDFQIELNDRQKAYEGMFKQAFKAMEDAIVNFVKTGKLSFKGMINSFLEDLLRYEIRQQQMMLFQGMGGAGGLANMFMGALGFSTAGPAVNTGITGYVGPTSYTLPGGKLAKGGAFDAGLKTFAQGGMFTNSIVSEPTLFKFARGTGLMGEAGPEAIMPLKRDSNGNLGVRSNNSGAKVDVVVNNYSNEKATAKETTDSRGNRRIEVIVGDMVAGELNRVGSTTQQAMTASYGTAPLLARR